MHQGWIESTENHEPGPSSVIGAQRLGTQMISLLMRKHGPALRHRDLKQGDPRADLGLPTSGSKGSEQKSSMVSYGREKQTG